MARFLKNKSESQGAAPGSLIFIGQRKMKNPLLRVVQYNNESLTEENLQSPANIEKYIADDQVTWISLYGLHNTKYIEQIGKTFEVPSLILEDILNTDERPKLAEDEKHIFIILKALYYDPEIQKIRIDQISFILGKNYLISLQESAYPYFQDIDKRLASGLSKIRSYSPDYLCYALMDTLVDGYILTIEKLGSNIEAQEKQLLTSDKKIIEDIYRYKTELSYIRKNIRPVKEVMTRFMTSDSDLINNRTFNYLKDLDSLVTQALEAIEIYYMMVADQQNIYNSNISNNVNDVMKILTIFSAIFIPLTFIVGVYGMNFEYMPALKYHWAYFVLWAVMLAIVVIMLLFFKRKKWI